MSRSVLLMTLFISLFLAPVRATPRSPALAWVFNVYDNHFGDPHGKVFLRVNGRKILVLPDRGLRYDLILRSGYGERNMPAATLIACSGWWAGGGVDLYVIRRGKTLKVFCRGLDEQAPIPPYRLLKSVSIPSRAGGG